METEFAGRMYALLSALSWACALVLFKRCGEKVSPLPLNLFKNIVGMVLLVLTLACLRNAERSFTSFETQDVLLLCTSGIIGIALADTAFFFALNRLGVSLMAIVECAYSPAVIFCAILMLSEDLRWPQYAGAGLIVSAVLLSTRHTPPAGQTRKQLMLGFIWGITAMLLMAFGIVLAKPVLEMQRFPLIWATTIRLAAGTVILLMLSLASPQRGKYFSVFRPTASWRISIPASILGTYLALIFWIAGFKYAKASIAAALNQTSSIFAIILATVVLKESFTFRKATSATLAIMGVLLVTLTK